VSASVVLVKFGGELIEEPSALATVVYLGLPTLVVVQQLATRQRVEEQVIEYAVRLVRATREHPGLALGSGSRGALALVRGARAVSLMDGRGYVTPDDIKRIALPALRHRVALAPDALLEGRRVNELLTEVLEAVPAPRM